MGQVNSFRETLLDRFLLPFRIDYVCRSSMVDLEAEEIVQTDQLLRRQIGVDSPKNNMSANVRGVLTAPLRIFSMQCLPQPMNAKPQQ